MMRRVPSSIPLTLALMGACGTAFARQEGPVPEAGAQDGRTTFIRPEAAKRLVRLWDFEERPGNVEPVPRDWFRSQHNPPGAPRPGFPSWNQAAFDDDLARSGSTSVRLPVRGGSASLTLTPGVLPAMPGGRYMVTAWARTQDLVSARAFIRTRLLDAGLEIIPGTETVSEPIQTGGQWVQVRTAVEGNDNAAWIQLELELLQPRDADPRGTLAHEVREQDFVGAAWFDDIAVYQVPLVDVRASGIAGVAVSPERPALTLRVQDLTGEALSARIVVRDIDGREAASMEGPIEPGGRPVVWTPDLGKFGWYRATLTVIGPSGPVSERTTDFGWAAPDVLVDRAERRAWGVVAEETTADRVPLLPDLLSLAGTGAVSVSVWSHVGLEPTAPAASGSPSRDDIDGTINRLIEQRQDVTFVLGRAPEELAREARTDPEDTLTILTGKNDGWIAEISPLLSRFGERVARWQVGPTGADGAFWRATLAADLRQIELGFRGLVPRPVMTAPWSLEQDTAGARGIDALTVTLPANIPAESLHLYARQWSGSESMGAGPGSSVPDVNLVIEQVGSEVFGERVNAEDLARRAVAAWSAGAPRVSVRSPWVFDASRAGGASPSPASPTPPLLAWRTVVSHLAGREPAGEMPVANGVVALLARGDSDGALVAWNSHAAAEDARIVGYLGAGEVTVTDVFGNTRVSVADAGGRHDVQLGESPVFIEGVDVNLLRLRAGVHLSPGYLPSRSERHTLNVVIENPWNTPVSGTIRLAEPESWDMSPRVIPIVLQAGQTKSFPFSVSLGVAEPSGTRKITAELQISGDRRYPMLRLELPVEVGLETIQMQPTFRYLTGADGTLSDLMVSLLVTNLDSQPATLETFVHAPGQRSQQAPISALGPGESAIRRFVFPGAAKTLRGATVRTGLREMGGTGRLNKLLQIQ